MVYNTRHSLEPILQNEARIELQEYGFHIQENGCGTFPSNYPYPISESEIGFESGVREGKRQAVELHIVDEEIDYIELLKVVKTWRKRYDS